MNSGAVRLASPRLGLLVVLGGPFLIALAAALGAGSALPQFGPQPVEAHRERLAEAFADLLDQAASAADATLAAADSGKPPRFPPGPLDRRIDGTAILDEQLELVSWTGNPANPQPRFSQSDWPRWSVRVDGMWTRLLVRSGPDSEGRLALVSAVIDTALTDRRFVELVPEDVRRGVRLEVTFQDTALLLAERRIDLKTTAPPRVPRDLPDSTPFWLRAPSGEILASVAMVPLSPHHLAATVRRAGAAWAVVLALAIVLTMADWPTRTRTARGLVSALIAIAFGRWLLVWQQVPARLLPRDLGTATLYGSSGPMDLLASPGDLLLTAIAVYLAAVALRRFLATLSESRRTLALSVSALSAVAATTYGLAVTASVARNSSIPLLNRPAPLEWDRRLVLWVGLILLLLGAAELWARTATFLRLRPIVTATPRLAVVVSLVLLLSSSSVVLQLLVQQVHLEQLSADLAPEVAEQTRRRMLIMPAVMREIQRRVLRHDASDPTLSVKREDMAYRYWVESRLFHSGYRSSLGFYTPAGDIVSSFGFGLPELEEQLILGADAQPGEIRLRQEQFEPTSSRLQNLIHAELAVADGDRPLRIVVGHILDEPDNLPFLPWSQPYLSALGPGSPGSGREYPERLHYVLYDAAGDVELTTLSRPPADCAEWHDAAVSGERVLLRSGDAPFVGIAVEDESDRLHLLLLRAPGFIGRIASTVRFVLLGLVVLLGIRSLALLRRIRKSGGVRALTRELRRSIYRKILAASLIAAGIPLIGLALFLRGYIERRADASLVAEATRLVGVARSLVEDYSTMQAEPGEADEDINDPMLYWLQNVVGQEIHVYENGYLLASSKRELFVSGLLPQRLVGEVQDRLIGEGIPSLVLRTPLGAGTMPVAYARIRGPDDSANDRVVAVPLALEQRQIAEGTARVAEMILLATVALFGLLAAAAAFLASSVSRPMRELVAATDRISAGDYTTRLLPRTGDEVEELVLGFNAMGTALERQRSDLQSQRDYMETLLFHDTTGVISLDVQGRIVTVNPAAARLLGEPIARRLTGMDLRKTLADRAELRPLAEAFAGPATPGQPIEVDLVREELARRYQVVRVDLEGAKGRDVGTLVLLDDVTDLMRSNQLAAWAEMARVIAHEIKNPLTPIQLSGEHLRRLLHDRGVLPSADLDACLDTIIKQVRSLHTIAGEFSTYAKLPDLQPMPQDPVEFMRQTLDPYRAAPPPGITLAEDYVATPHVAIDARVLGRAVINLVENALQAMDDGGRLTVIVRPADDGTDALLRIQDSGPGLAPEMHWRLFEPYLSTKSSGTGLGLAIVRRAVEAHGGVIDVESEPGRGAAFTIRLPLGRRPA